MSCSLHLFPLTLKLADDSGDIYFLHRRLRFDIQGFVPPLTDCRVGQVHMVLLVDRATQVTPGTQTPRIVVCPPGPLVAAGINMRTLKIFNLP